jgi:hypothetical protein
VVKSFPLDIQHIEYEGEVQRTIILFFNVNKELLLSDNYKSMCDYLKTKCVAVAQNIINFVEKIDQLQHKVFKKKKKQIFTIQDAEHDLNMIDNNFELNENNNNIELEENNDEKKIFKIKQIKIQSGECMLLFSIIFYFFFDFITKNILKFEIKNLICHKNICDILNKFEITGKFKKN